MAINSKLTDTLANVEGLSKEMQALVNSTLVAAGITGSPGKPKRTPNLRLGFSSEEIVEILADPSQFLADNCGDNSSDAEEKPVVGYMLMGGNGDELFPQVNELVEGGAWKVDTLTRSYVKHPLTKTAKKGKDLTEKEKETASKLRANAANYDKVNFKVKLVRTTEVDESAIPSE